ncbi:MAG: hypothetical protein J3R72DRAFT_103309 [Linnemannia gamsii]|nr:MAG: hypothetical protein J3R72DRAFT_103309 [Linnemannia gamsii]
MPELPTEMWWLVFDSLNVCDLLQCTMVSHAMKDDVMTYKPTKSLDMSILPAHKRRAFSIKALTETLKQIFTNHHGLDMSGTLTTRADLDVLLRMNLDWISIERCAAMTSAAAVKTFSNTVRKHQYITTDLYILDAGIPLHLGSIESLAECNDRARIFVHSCCESYIDISTVHRHVDEMAPCHQCGTSTSMYTSCSGCRLCTCRECKTSKCTNFEVNSHNSHGSYCAGCVSTSECTLCGSPCCVWCETSQARLRTCTICGLRSCTTCTPTMHSCNKCRNVYCGLCFSTSDNEPCMWKCN